MKMDTTEAYVYAQLKESLFSLYICVRACEDCTCAKYFEKYFARNILRSFLAVLIYFLKKKICAVRKQVYFRSVCSCYVAIDPSRSFSFSVIKFPFSFKNKHNSYFNCKKSLDFHLSCLQQITLSPSLALF